MRIFNFMIVTLLATALPMPVLHAAETQYVPGKIITVEKKFHERVLYYLGANRSSACFASRSGSRLLLIGGPPFPETILMWWNFVARTPGEIADARADWEERRRFGDVTGYPGPRLAAPSLVRFASPNPAS